MKISMIRHGETVANAAKILQGQVDGKLNERGIAQVKSTADHINLSDYDVILCSDLGRTRETLAILEKGESYDVIFTDKIRELKLGIYENTPNGTLEIESSKRGIPLIEYKLPQGESIQESKDRINAAREEFKQTYAGKHILLITHGGVVANMFLGAFGLDNSHYSEFEVDNASLSILSFESEPKVELLNKTWY